MAEEEDRKPDGYDAERIVSELSMRMQRGYFSRKYLSPKIEGLQADDISVMHRRKKAYGRLSLSQIFELIHQVVIGKEKLSIVAKTFRTTVSTVSRYVNRAKKRPKYLGELLAKRDEMVGRRKAINDIVSELNSQDAFIGSAKMIPPKVKK